MFWPEGFAWNTQQINLLVDPVLIIVLSLPSFVFTVEAAIPWSSPQTLESGRNISRLTNFLFDTHMISNFPPSTLSFIESTWPCRLSWLMTRITPGHFCLPKVACLTIRLNLGLYRHHRHSSQRIRHRCRWVSFLLFEHGLWGRIQLYMCEKTRELKRKQSPIVAFPC